MRGLFVALLVAVAPGVQAADIFAGAHGGLLGLGAEVGMDFGKTRVRLQINEYDIDETSSLDGVDYDVDLNLESTGVLVDYAPFDGIFFLTAGLYDNGTAVSAVSESTSVQVGNSTVTGRVFADVDFDDTAPYFGLGWRFLNGTRKSGFGISTELGVYMNGSPDVSLTTSDPTFNQNNQADIRQEEQNIEDDADSADMLPVAKLGLSWYF